MDSRFIVPSAKIASQALTTRTFSPHFARRRILDGAFSKSHAPFLPEGRPRELEPSNDIPKAFPQSGSRCQKSGREEFLHGTPEGRTLRNSGEMPCEGTHCLIGAHRPGVSPLYPRDRPMVSKSLVFFGLRHLSDSEWIRPILGWRGFAEQGQRRYGVSVPETLLL